MVVRRFAALFALLALEMGGSVLAQPVPAGTPAAPTAASVMRRIMARNVSLHSFQARVNVHIRMLTFPYLAPHLSGTSYYKSPGRYEIVFDRVPSYAHGITKLFGDIGDPAGWTTDSNVVYSGIKYVGGHPYYTLTISKKIRSDQLKEAVAFVDPSTYDVIRMEWHYYNGGSIVMTQAFRRQGAYTLVASQHADIHIPFVHAVADASYGTYHTNVAIADTVFTAK